MTITFGRIIAIILSIAPRIATTIIRITTTIIGLFLALFSIFACDSGTRASYYVASYLCAAGLLFFSSGVSGSVLCFSFSCCMYASFFLTSYLMDIDRFSEMSTFSFVFVLGCLLVISFSLVLLGIKMIGREGQRRRESMMWRTREEQDVHIMDKVRSAAATDDGDHSVSGTGVGTPEERGGLLLVSRVEDMTQKQPTVYAKLYQGSILHDNIKRGQEKDFS